MHASILSAKINHVLLAEQEFQIVEKWPKLPPPILT
jgi:hypothetical protein